MGEEKTKKQMIIKKNRDWLVIVSQSIININHQTWRSGVTESCAKQTSDAISDGFCDGAIQLELVRAGVHIEY